MEIFNIITSIPVVQAVVRKFGKDEDEHVVASDAELDAKLDLFRYNTRPPTATFVRKRFVRIKFFRKINYILLILPFIS
jgi:hypothetical protein